MVLIVRLKGTKILCSNVYFCVFAWSHPATNWEWLAIIDGTFQSSHFKFSSNICVCVHECGHVVHALLVMLQDQ
jgi:hypothetical protein